MATHLQKTLKRTINLKQLLKCIGFIVLALYLSVTLLNQQRRINDNVAQTHEIHMQTEEMNLQNAILQETLSQVGTDEHIERVAREQRRLVLPGDRIFIDSARIR